MAPCERRLNAQSPGAKVLHKAQGQLEITAVLSNEDLSPVPFFFDLVMDFLAGAPRDLGDDYSSPVPPEPYKASPPPAAHGAEPVRLPPRREVTVRFCRGAWSALCLFQPLEKKPSGPAPGLRNVSGPMYSLKNFY